ncbi:MAG: DoxX family membrane protein [Acidobacteriota bacterium]|nr:DoxX family membrane protein [Acidobacteriota bacterium]
MRIAMILVRSLLGLLFVFASVTYFFKLITPPPPAGAMKVFNDGLEASRYLMPTVKVVELVCGLAFLSGRWVPLASVLIAPIIVNIFLISVFLVGPQGLPLAVFVVLANGFLAYYHRDRYRPLFRA